MTDQNTHIKNYEDVTVYGLDPAEEDLLVSLQNECTFGWITKDGSPMSLIMSYLRTDDGAFWLTACDQRKRVDAIRKDPRVTITITSAGIPQGSGFTVSYKGIATVHDDEETKAWFCPAMGRRLTGCDGSVKTVLDSGDGEAAAIEFANMLNSPRRAVISVAPGARISYDGRKLKQATDDARAAGNLVWEA
jgi:hypothetical protein